jgi:ubiquinone/menaquinone biosynthesis C-methylase UbiE
MGLRRSFWTPFFGVPQGLLGRIGAQLMTRVSRPFQAAMADELELQPDDELLDVGCGSAGLLVEQARHVRHVAGIDASTIQVVMARRRLAERVAAGSAEIVVGDAATLPWQDGRFSVVTSVNALKFFPDPDGALQEMHRVLRPGGRAVVTMGEAEEAPAASTEGVMDAWGQWQWSDAAARQAMEDAGFAEVAVSVLPVFSKAKLVRGIKPVPVTSEEGSLAAAPVEHAVV